MEPQNLTIRDWKVPRYVVNPCPICKAEMLKTMNEPGMVILECQEKGCTGREVRTNVQ